MVCVAMRAPCTQGRVGVGAVRPLQVHAHMLGPSHDLPVPHPYLPQTSHTHIALHTCDSPRPPCLHFVHRSYLQKELAELDVVVDLQASAAKWMRVFVVRDKSVVNDAVVAESIQSVVRLAGAMCAPWELPSATARPWLSVV